MKILVKKQEDILCMAKLTSKYADKSITGVIHDFVYFSNCNQSHEPRIKFYGGTSHTMSTKNAPSMSFGISGEPELVIYDWMNKKNCPYAFDKQVIEDIRYFIIKNRPILLLVWFRKLNEEDALHYFEGTLNWEELVDCIGWKDNQIEHICKTMDQLHEQCLKYNMYQF